jgi:hypothetical protein
VTIDLIALVRAMFTARPLLVAGVLYLVFASPEPSWYVPVQLIACVLQAYLLLCAGRDLRGRMAHRLGRRRPGAIYRIGR